MNGNERIVQEGRALVRAIENIERDASETAGWLNQTLEGWLLATYKMRLQLTLSLAPREVKERALRDASPKLRRQFLEDASEEGDGERAA
jgi:hypothetical protein